MLAFNDMRTHARAYGAYRQIQKITNFAISKVSETFFV